MSMTAKMLVVMVVLFAGPAAVYSSEKNSNLPGPSAQVIDENKKEVPVVSPESSEIAVSTAPQVGERTNIDKLSDPDPMVRRNAIIYLGSEKKKSSVARLLIMLDDENAEVRRAAINALAAIGDSRAAGPLMDKFKKETNINIKMNIIIALGELKSAAAIPLLKTVLKDPYPAFRNEAVHAFGKINSVETYKDIVGMLNDEAEGVRVRAADVVGKLKLRSAETLLIKNLKDPVAVVRQACAKAMGEVGQVSSMVELEKLLEDKNESVVAAAKDAIEKIRKRSAEKKTSK